jgi:acetyltransferase-like isoleucine patch superfamily enzyme
MRNIFSYLYRLFLKKCTKLLSTKRNLETLRSLAEENPTCKIMSTNLHNVTLGKYVAIITGAFLNKVDIGDFSYISNSAVVSNVEIGKFCSIGSSVQIGLAPHPSKVFVSTYPAFYTEKISGCPLSFREDNIFDDAIPKTTIANDVWIGANVIIPGRIHIGTGAIVAAGSVLVKDVPPYAIVGGNPARVIRYRFTENQIKILLKSKWWNWPTEKILQHVDDFSNIEKFLKLVR